MPKQDIGTAAGTETEAKRYARRAQEADMIAEARDDGAAGRLVDAAEVRAWVDSLRTANPLPVRCFRRRSGGGAPHAQLYWQGAPRPRCRLTWVVTHEPATG